MSTLNINPKIIYKGNGKQPTFPFSFPAASTEYIKVHVLRAGGVDEDSKTLLSQDDYSYVIEPTSTTGGEIKFPAEGSTQAVLGEGDKLCITRVSELGNDYIFSNQSRLFPKSVEDADDALSLQIMDLMVKMKQSVQASLFDDRTPSERWREMLAALKEAQNIIDRINLDFTDIPEKLAQETYERKLQDATILETVSNNKIDCNAKISALTNKVDTEIQERKSADLDTIKKTVLPDVVSTVTPLFSESRVAINITKKDTETGSLSDSIMALPVASESQHGVMPKEAYASLTELGSRVSSLEGGQAKTYAVHMGQGPFTQSDYQDVWETASGSDKGATPPDGTKLTNLDTNIDIQFFASQNAWVERQVSVPVATSETTGVVKGSTTNGKITVEQDGSMSLNGYDSLVSKTESNKSDIDKETGRATASESELSTRLQGHIDDNVRHVTAEERTAWNEKYSKPDSGIPAEDLSNAIQVKLLDMVSQTAGGTMAAKLSARNTDPSTDFEVRNIKAVASSDDPGVGSALANGNIILVYE